MRTQGQSHGVGRCLFGIGLAVLTMLMLGLIQPASAQVDRVSCGFFETQQDAQAALDARPELAVTLDSDGNGIACEELQTGGPIVVDPVSCGFFETQEDAQAALDENPELAVTLDSDGNGIACEELPTGEQSVVVCNEALGTLVEVSQTALDQGSLDFPFHRATDAEIAAGKCAVTTPGPDAISLGIWKFNCPNAAAAEGDYADCKPGGNATFQVATADGKGLGSCTTEVGVVRDTEVGFCYVGNVPFDTQLVITEDVSTGFVPLENPKTLTIDRPSPDAADFTPTVIFVNLPAEELETPEPTPSTAPVTPKAEGEQERVSALPKTGAGTAGEVVQPGPLMPVFLTVLVLTTSAIGLRLRMQRTQS